MDKLLNSNSNKLNYEKINIKLLLLLLLFVQDYKHRAYLVLLLEDGEPAGVNIVVQGQNQGAVSDFDGNFTIANFESGWTLVFSYVGYKTLNLKIS